MKLLILLVVISITLVACNDVEKTISTPVQSQTSSASK